MDVGKQLIITKNKTMTKRRYIVELTPSQLSVIQSSLEIAELDLTGGSGYESGINAHSWKKHKRHIISERINVAISEAREKGLKTIK
tara:strand:- start:1304 stop:1564 length:261 start_codon:yes stop_codon:yes gene_type:complete